MSIKQKECKKLKYYQIDLKIEIEDDKNLPYYCPKCKTKLEWIVLNEHWRVYCEKCKKSWDIIFNPNHV